MVKGPDLAHTCGLRMGRIGMVMVAETDLYAPIKDLLEARGYEVKAEVNGCDVVALKPGAQTIIVELKLTFSLDLVLQGIERLGLADAVYLAVAAPATPGKRKNWRGRRPGYLKLCRRLGLGLMQVELDRWPGAQVKILADPTPYMPRKNKRRQSRLMTEFRARSGDPNTGGVSRTKIITAYRQDALACAAVLAGPAELPLAQIRERADVPRAASILQKNHYGWFERRARGVYGLSDLGRQGLTLYKDILPTPGKHP